MHTNHHRQKRATTRSNKLQTAALLAVCASIVLGTAGPVGAQLADSAWPDYGGGYLNQHRSPHRGPAGAPTVLWTFDLQTIGAQGFQKGFHQPILLPDGTIVLNTADSSDDQIVALNPDGTFRWRFDESSLGPWLAADQNDRIYTIRHTYAMSSSARLRAVDFEGGGLWATSLPGSNPTQNGPAVGRDGNVYAAVDFSALQAISSNGAVDWSSASAGYYDNPAVAPDGTIYIGGENLKAMTSDGRLLWTRSVRNQYPRNGRYLSPAIGEDGRVFAGQTSSVSNLVALDSATGKAIWTRTDLDGTPAIGPNETLYIVGGNTGKVFAVVPEPSTLALLGVGTSGLAVFGWWRRRKRRRSHS